MPRFFSAPFHRLHSDATRLSVAAAIDTTRPVLRPLALMAGDWRVAHPNHAASSDAGCPVQALLGREADTLDPVENSHLFAPTNGPLRLNLHHSLNSCPVVFRSLPVKRDRDCACAFAQLAEFVIRVPERIVTLSQVSESRPGAPRVGG